MRRTSYDDDGDDDDDDDDDDDGDDDDEWPGSVPTVGISALPPMKDQHP